MTRSLIVGAVCFLMGAFGLALAQTTGLRPDQFIALAWTWTGIQTFTNSALKLLGSSTGKTTFTSANSGSSNFTLTIPAVTDTVAVLGTAQQFTKPQAVELSTPAISTSTFTPDMTAGQDFKIVLVHASCPCTIANPIAPSFFPQHGVIEIDQSATGGDTVGTWGGQWIYPGGTATIALSTGTNAKDFFSYDAIDSTHYLILTMGLNATH